jgi:methylthioribose-1-phosphate isomerase
MIRTLFWKNNSVVMIDQNALPQIERPVVCADYRQVIAAIRDLTVRGAPAIGVAAAMGAALGALTLPPQPRRRSGISFRPSRRNRRGAAHRTQSILGAGADEKTPG